MFPSATSLAIALALSAATNAVPLKEDAPRAGKRCTGTISSLSDVAAAQLCTTININAFTVPGGSLFALSPPTGSTVNLLGKVTFAHATDFVGPQFTLSGTSVTFNGGGYTFDGLGATYWDGLGGNGGVVKPAPMIKFTNSGSVSNLIVLNTPARAISVGNTVGPLTISGVTIDNSAGDAGKLGHNTDCFDVSSTGGLTIKNNKCLNQDDCLAINKGKDITFTGNTCSGGHGVSIGSISAGVTVNNVVISSNTITSSTNGLRIKTKAEATGATVSGVVYTGNTASGITEYGVIIDQSYPDTNGTPGTGVIISNVTFSGTNKLAVSSAAERVLINCASTSTCTGTWNLGGLTVTGGTASSVKGVTVTGGSY